MEVEVLKNDKNDLEFKLDDVTVAEVLRVYLNNQNIEFAAWRREHPTKPAKMKVTSSSKTAKKEVADAVSSIKKDLDKIVKSVK